MVIELSSKIGYINQIFSYLFGFIFVHNTIYNLYPFEHHTFKNKTKNIVESFNILTNIVCCTNFCIIIYELKDSDTISKINSVTSNSIFAFQLLCANLIYESIYYFIVLKRKENLVLGHHIYTIITIATNLIYHKLHYISSMMALVEITNIFLSSSYIVKRNNLSYYLLIPNGLMLLLTFISFRIFFIPYIFYEATKDFLVIINDCPVLYLNGLFVIILIWCMSVMWFKRIFEIVDYDIKNYKVE